MQALPTSYPYPCCTDSVRLVDGGSRCAGRVEVLHRGQWGTVCDDDWDMRDAAVVCRELRCGEAVDALSDAHFGPGSGPIWMGDIHCSGSESLLRNCFSLDSSKHNCDHSKDAGVICSGKLYCNCRKVLNCFTLTCFTFSFSFELFSFCMQCRSVEPG